MQHLQVEWNETLDYRKLTQKEHRLYINIIICVFEYTVDPPKTIGHYGTGAFNFVQQCIFSVVCRHMDKHKTVGSGVHTKYYALLKFYCVNMTQLILYNGSSEKGPSEKRTVRNVPKLSFPIAIMDF